MLTLRAYDAQHHTSLYETLGCYLENERNLTRTARALFLHRSTLLYRLSRIEALTHLDLEDPQLQLHLEL
ncbi:helix-turn-helix domain-containing protein [Eubacterium aggregans]|uniref:helix-turn-helix domain-containing protein n=1 Tax=Eubacterium aggregans TaxID=81409 RepID=UPI003F34BCCE